MVRSSDIDRQKEINVPPTPRVFVLVGIFTMNSTAFFEAFVVKHLLPFISMTDDCVSFDSEKVIKRA